MPAAVYDFKIEKGTSWHLDLILKSGNDLPISLVGYQGLCKIKTTALLETSVASPTVEIIDPMAGRMRLSLTKEETLAIPTKGRSYKEYSTYYYDVFLITEDNISTRILNGTVLVSPEVSF